MVGRVRKTPRGILSARQVGATDFAPTDFHNSVGRHCPVGSETGHEVPDNLPNQSETLVIPITLGGISGAITARFIKFPFNHADPDSQGGQHNHVA